MTNECITLIARGKDGATLMHVSQKSMTLPDHISSPISSCHRILTILLLCLVVNSWMPEQ